MSFAREDLAQVAIPKLNQLHAEEVDMINALADQAGRVLAGAGAAGSAELERQLAAFELHVAGHFEIEESNMQRTAYPGLAEHRAEHERIRAQLDELLVAWRSAGDAAELEGFFSQALPVWFIEHVERFDTPTALHVVACSTD